jgi:hypothetical protein
VKLTGSRIFGINLLIGIYQETNCSQTAGSYALQLVGYGNTDNVPYWIAKNSWGLYKH